MLYIVFSEFFSNIIIDERIYQRISKKNTRIIKISRDKEAQEQQKNTYTFVK